MFAGQDEMLVSLPRPESHRFTKTSMKHGEVPSSCRGSGGLGSAARPGIAVEQAVRTGHSPVRWKQVLGKHRSGERLTASPRKQHPPIAWLDVAASDAGHCAGRRADVTRSF